MNNIVSIRDLTFKYDERKIIDNLNLEVEKGSIFGLVGNNGAGKTTLIQIMLGLIKAEEGEVEICACKNSDIFKGKVGFLPEHPYYHQEFRVKEYLSYLSKISDREITEEEIDNLIRLFYLDGVKDEYLKGFSKGMLQRVGLAQCILERPELIILDEPMSGLDPVGQSKLREIILKINNEGTTVFITSHNLQEVERICDDIGVLHNGEIKVIDKELLNSNQYYQIVLEANRENSDLIEYLNRLGIELNKNQFKIPVIKEELYFKAINFLVERRIKMKSLTITGGSLESVILNYLNEGGEGDD